MNKMKFRAMSLIVSTLLMVSLGYSQDKVALLIANSDLRVQKLPEAKQKAEIMAVALKAAGFKVTLKENVKSIYIQQIPLRNKTTNVGLQNVVIRTYLSQIGDYCLLIGDSVLLICYYFPLIGDHVLPMGDQFLLIGDKFSLIGDYVSLIAW